MIDTNVLLDWLLVRDSAKSQRIDTMLRCGRHFQVPDVVLTELAFALEKHYRLTRHEVAANLRLVTAEAAFDCNDKLMANVLETYTERSALSFVDCYVMALAEATRALPVYTSDKKMVAQSGGRAEAI